jgi:arylsulfatase A-like enzyme
MKLPISILLLTAGYSLAVEKPNVVLIMSDDMGISDLGCYGSEIATPRLDDLAANGLRFTQFYNTARCCPTRASLLSGLYPHQAGVGHMMEDRGHDGYRGELNRNCMTIAEALKTAGYGTYMAGKWHVTSKTAADGPKENWPRQRGFDRFYGTIHGAGSLWDPNSLTRDNTQITPLNDTEYKPAKRWFYTDAIADQTSRYIREHVESKPSDPFFCYVSFTAAHWPMHAREETIAKYKGRYDAGYAAFRKSRFEKMKQLGIITADTELSPIAEDWSKVKNVEWETRCMEVYAAMVDEMDQGIGSIIDTLKATNQFDKTLIFFLQDNGGCAENFGRAGVGQPRADKPSLPVMGRDELQMQMQPKQTREGYPVRTGVGAMPGPDDTYIGYGRGWANVSNTPFREYKHWVHEGGISTPLIAHWPRGIKRVGQLDHQPSHLIDIMATCADLAGVDYPKNKTPLEGRSLDVAFKGNSIERDALFWEHEGNCAIRKGNWKLVRKENKEWELYDIDKDRSELKNLAAEKSDLVTKLAAEFQIYADRANVSPVGTWRGQRKAAKSPPKKANPMAPIVDDPKLPRVLLIGDSISIGYTLDVRQMLAGVANVHRPLTNCGPTTNGLKNLDQWLGNGKWDVIHFNWGLHDLKYITGKKGQLADINAPGAQQQVLIEDYEKNLTTLVERLKKTGAKLIWRNTTPVPESAKGRIVGDSVKYNKAAARVMSAHSIPTHDLYTFAKQHAAEIQNKADVHFSPKGSKRLAKEVVREIKAKL